VNVILVASLPAVAAAEVPSPRAARAYERRIYPAVFDASSVRANTTAEFRADDHPNYLADDDATTVWTEGAAGDGRGETLTLSGLALPEDVTQLRLRVRTGCRPQDGARADHPRARQVKVVILPSRAHATVELADTAEWQDVVVDQPVGELDTATLEVASVYPGKASDDLCFADVQTYITALGDDDAWYEKRKRGALMEWRKQRALAAKLFAEQIDRLPFLPSYDYALVDGDPAGDDGRLEACGWGRHCFVLDVIAEAAETAHIDRRFAPALALATRALDGTEVALEPVKLESADTTQVPVLAGFQRHDLNPFEDDGPLPGGVDLPLPAGLGAFRVETLGAKAVKSKVTLGQIVDDVPKARGCGTRKGADYVWAVRDRAATPTDLHAFVVARCGLISVRDGEVKVVHLQVLVYDRAGQLMLVAGPGYVSSYEWGQIGGRAVVVAGQSLTSEGARGTLRARHAPPPVATAGRAVGPASRP
jgi:hypothetical protein